MISRKTALCLAAATAFAAAAAQAHINFVEPSAQAGSYYAGFLRVSHGCGGSATVSIRVEIPAGVNIARPQPKPGWTLSIAKEVLPAPIRSEGGEVRERVKSITWTGRLESDQFDQLGVLLKLPDAPGKLYFPTVQRCETGEADWTMISGAGQDRHALAAPAPMLEVVSKQAAPMDHSDHMNM